MTENSIGDRVKQWVKKPYSDEMSVTGWFMFLGLLAVLTYLWTRILRAIAVNA